MSNRKILFPAVLIALQIAIVAFLAFRQTEPTVEKVSTEVTIADALEHFEMDALLAELKTSGGYYLPFLNRNTLRCGIYTLAAEAEDPQSPHDLDEVYYVLSGKARFTVEKEDVAIKEGDVLFVKAHATHRFHSIEEDLKLLVFFSTKEVED